MKRQQLIEDIQYIKNVINSSLCYTNLSGTAAIISGIMAIIGCILAYICLQIPSNPNIFWQLFIIGTLVFCISLVAHIYFIMRKARQNNEPVLSRLAKLALYALSPPLFVGGILTIFMIHHNVMIWLPAVWMICYGLGVWSAGLFSISEARWLGATFIITGIATLFWLTDYGLIMLAVSFGGYHILYGWRLLLRYDGG